MSKSRFSRAGACLRGAAAAAALALAGCSGWPDLPAPLGVPDEAPARPQVAPEYPAVFDTPPARPEPTLSEAERKALEADLAAARKRQADRAAADAGEPGE